MGKDLKGKELGRGLRQNKDKRYEGRYTDRFIMFRKQCHIKYKKCAVSLDFTAFSGLAFKKRILQNVTFLGIFYHKNGVQNGVREIVIRYTKDDRRKAFGNIKG